MKYTLLFFEEALRERAWQRADIYEKVESERTIIIRGRSLQLKDTNLLE